MPILGTPHIVVGVGGTKKALAVCGKTGAADHEESLMNANTISNIPEMMELIKAVAHIGLDWGYGEFKLTDEHIKKARAIYEAQGSKEGQKPPTPSCESMITETPETDALFSPLWSNFGINFMPPTENELHEVTKSHRRLERERDDARNIAHDLAVELYSSQHTPEKSNAGRLIKKAMSLLPNTHQNHGESK